MKKKIQFKMWWLGLIAGCFTACHEYDMGKYSEKPAVNFAMLDSYGNLHDEPSALAMTFQFTYQNGLEDTVGGVVVMRQGLIDDMPLDVAVKTQEVANARAAEVSVLAKCRIPVGEYLDSVRAVVKCPELEDSTYVVDLVFDYANSNVGVGIEEKQTFRLYVVNQVWKSTGITPQIWESSFARYVGEFSRVKAKFMCDFFEGTLPEIQTIIKFAYTALPPALEQYNNTHDEPLKDEYGNLITFEP